LSNFNFSPDELSQIATSIYREYSDYIDHYEDRQVAKQEAEHEHEKRSDLEIRLDNFRWFFENISLANQLETLATYTKYDQDETITHYHIDVLASCKTLSKKEIYNKLKSIRYNSSRFLNPKITDKLDYLISLVSDDLIRSQKEVLIN